MRLVQFVIPAVGRRVGLIQDTEVVDLTSVNDQFHSVYDLIQQAFADQKKLTAIVEELAAHPSASRLSYRELLAATPEGVRPYLIIPIDHPEPARALVTGTGLTHLGSMQSRDQMHGGTQAEEPQTDSAKMFAMGLKGGRPAANERGVSPEWFYKGCGLNLRGPNATLEIPAYALDGGEEPEIVGCYIIDPNGQPRRIGFVLGNEWSDHATEKINYLYLAPSKLRECSIGPSLQVGDYFEDIPLRCTVSRNGKQIYDSGEMRSGEKNICHSLKNMEDHHFKYAQHRRPGDIHLHFFGTSKLSFGSRDWSYQPGDEIRIEAKGFCEPLINTVSAGPHTENQPIVVEDI